MKLRLSGNVEIKNYGKNSNSNHDQDYRIGI
jgi:hypothetical protein